MIKLLIHSLILMLFINCSEKKEPNPVGEDNRMIADIISLVNKHRKSKGLAALTENEACSREAELHSKNMATGKTPYGHDGFDDRFDLLAEEINATSMAENVATGQSTASEVMDDWLNSTGHRENIEGDYTHIGVGVYAASDGTLFFTQIFVRI